MALWKFKDNELVKVAGNYGSIPDTALSETSANPIQNKAVTIEINSLKNTKADRSELTEISEELEKKVDAVEGKSLTDVNFTGAYEFKLSNIEEGANKTIVDSALSTESVNPLQNKIITTEINTIKTNKLNSSDFTTFKNEIVEDLKEFYTKSEVYNKDEIDQRISSIPKLSISVVDTLPTENISNETIYLLKINGGEDRNLYYEYIYVNNKWENLGKQDIDLSGFLTSESFNTQIANYYNKTQVDAELAKYLPLTGGKLTGDLEIEATDPTLKLNSAEITANGFTNLSIYSPYNVILASGAKNITLSETDAVLKPTSGLSLGSSTNSWLNIYGSTIYQGGKQVANKEDLDLYLPLSAGSEKALTADLYIDNGGTDKSVVFSSGARIRGNGSGALILSAKDGYGIYFNPKGNTNSDEGVAIIGGAMNPRITDNVYLGTQSLQWKQIHGKEIYEGGERVVIQPTLNGYLPLTAGADKKLTGDLYFDTSSADRKIDFSGGSVIKGNSAGSLILSSKTGMPVYITANGESLSGNKNVIEIYSTAFAPRTTDLMYMGTSSNKWKGIYGVKTYANEAYEYDTDGTTLRRLATKLYVDNSVAPKLDRVDGSTTTQAYGVGSTGQQTMFQITQGVTTNALVRRNGTQIKVDETPVSDNDATSKKYVDETASAIETNIGTELENYVPKKSGNGLYTQSSDGSVYIKGMGQNEPGANQVILWTANRTVRSAAPVDDNDLVNLAYANSNYLSSGTKYGSSFDLSLDPNNYKLSVTLKDQDGTSLSTKEVDLPLESIILSAEYKDSYTHNGTTYTKVIVISLSTTDSPVIIPVADLVSGLQSEITSTNKLSVNLIDGLSTVATSGDYNDLANKPTIPTDNSQLANGAGYVKNTDYATTDVAGVVKVKKTSGVYISDGLIYVYRATDEEIAAKEDKYNPIVPYNLDYAVKSGIVNNANTLTEEEKTNVLNWIGALSSDTELFSGDYNDLINKPTIPTNNNQLTNGAGYITASRPIGEGIGFTSQNNTGFTIYGDSISENLYTYVGASDTEGWYKLIDKYGKLYSQHKEVAVKEDIPDWAKAATKPTYKFSEITEKPEFATIATSGKLADAAEDDTHVTITAAEKTRLSTLTNYDDSEIRNLLNGKADSDSYLPLTAGEAKPLTGSLYITSDPTSVWGQGIEFTDGAHIGSTGKNMGIKADTYIYFRIGDVTKVRLSSTQFQPASNNTMSLGSVGTQWLNMYAKNVYKNGEEVATIGDIPTIPENIAYTNASNIFTPLQAFSNGATIGESSLYAVVGADEKNSVDLPVLSVPDGVTLEIGNDTSDLNKILLKNTVQAPSFTDGTTTKTMTEILSGSGGGGGTKIKWRKW